MTTAVGRPRGPYASTARRRHEIARAVLGIVAEKGHGHVTTAEVAQRSGSREATVMYHFPTKDHLLVAALQLADEDNDRRLSGDEPAALDLAELRAFAQAVPGRANVIRLHVTLAGDATIPGHPAHDYFAARYRTAIDRFAGLVRERQEAGLADQALDPVEVARQVIAAWDGLQAQWLVTPDFDLGELLVSAVRRLTGQDWMEARQALPEPGAGA